MSANISLRTLAIDYGQRRVGFALSDEGGRFATPLEVITVSSPADAAAHAVRIAREQGVARLVVGLPLNMDDTLGPAAIEAGRWGKELASRAALPVLFVDERLSSFAAEQSLIERKRGGEHLTRGGKKRRHDALAAADFLQAFLDGRLAPINPP